MLFRVANNEVESDKSIAQEFVNLYKAFGVVERSFILF